MSGDDVEQKEDGSVDMRDSTVIKVLTMRWVLPLAPFIASAIYLRYLNLIGRPDLFLVTFSNTTGIVSFFIVFLILTAVAMFVVISPSLFLAAMSHQLRKEITGSAIHGLPKGIAFIGLGVLFTLAFFAKNWIFVGVVLGPLLGVALHLLFMKTPWGENKWSEIFSGNENADGWLSRGFSYSGVLSVAGVMTVLPMVMAVPFISVNDESFLANFKSMLILLLVAGASLLPAFIYCAMASKEKSLVLLVSGFLTTTLAIGYFILLAAPESFDRVLERAATMVGLRVHDSFRYVVNIEQLDASALDARLWSSKQEKQGVSLDARMPLSFGDSVVLCPVSLKSSQDLQRDALAKCISTKRDAVTRLPSQSLADGAR